MKVETLSKKIESGEFDLLLKMPDSKDNQERRAKWKKAYSWFQWRCLEATRAPHNKDSRKQFLEVFEWNIKDGLAVVLAKWLELANLEK